ncbi:MAG: 1,4-beta-xylanase [Bacteroidetes bacterium]|nr:1,4-beta-xylanase [Bacteroidota bacterium]
MFPKFITCFFGLICLSFSLNAQTDDHKWVNEIPENYPRGLVHKTFYSELNKTEIGYSIALPPGYSDSANANRRYPVVYFLHGGNPGNETRTYFIRPTDEVDSLFPIIYVWNNGGKHRSHYDFPQFNSFAESSFIEELIPFIDSTYRTVPDRTARGLLGYSMGGRAAARYIFRYPELFSVSVSISPGHQWEKQNADSSGFDGEFQPNDNSWDLAKTYKKDPSLPIHLYMIVGNKDANYESNVAYSSYLDSLNIPHTFTVIQGVSHGPFNSIIQEMGYNTFHLLFYQYFKNAVISNNEN